MGTMIRSYREDDYEQLKKLYEHHEWYGGVFDEARDGRERLARKIADDPEAILVYEQDGEIVGTISIIEDGRVAWLYRFVVRNFDPAISRQLYERAITVLKARGHQEVLVYSSAGDHQLDEHYESLGMARGSDYTCFWKKL